jgi:ankyrin repeat protein
LIEDHGADVHACEDEEDCEDVLNSAVMGKHIEIVKYLVKKHKDAIRKFVVNAILNAVQIEEFDIVKYLITEGGADVSDYGEHVLYDAAKNGNIDIVKCLVGEHGVNVDTTDNDRDPIEVAIKKNHVEVVKYLATKSSIQDQFEICYYAGKHGYREIINQILALYTRSGTCDKVYFF